MTTSGNLPSRDVQTFFDQRRRLYTVTPYIYDGRHQDRFYRRKEIKGTFTKTNIGPNQYTGVFRQFDQNISATFDISFPIGETELKLYDGLLIDNYLYMIVGLVFGASRNATKFVLISYPQFTDIPARHTFEPFVDMNDDLSMNLWDDQYSPLPNVHELDTDDVVQEASQFDPEETISAQDRGNIEIPERIVYSGTLQNRDELRALDRTAKRL